MSESDNPSPRATQEFRACVFELGGHTFALRLESISEIVPMAALSRPPSMPSILEGLLNLRGTSVPVVKLAALIGATEPRLELHTPLLIVRDGSLLLAFVVKRVIGIVPVAAGGLMSNAQSDSFNGCVEGQFLSAGTPVHLLALGRLLLEKERRALADFHAIETTRLSQLARATS